MILKSYFVLLAQEWAVLDFSFKSPHKSNMDKNSFVPLLVSTKLYEIGE